MEEEEKWLTKEWEASSFISKTSYSEDQKVLKIDYKSGDEILYRNFPLEEWNKLISAESVGKFFHKEIKGKYDYKQLN